MVLSQGIPQQLYAGASNVQVLNPVFPMVAGRQQT